jgi:hypothetical protein
MLPGRLHEGRGDAAPREMVAPGVRAGTESGLQAGSPNARPAPPETEERVVPESTQKKKCPVCGQGDLVEVTFREGATGAEDEAIQTADTRQVETYSCGHELLGPRLDQTAAGTDELDAERRTSQDTTETP